MSGQSFRFLHTASFQLDRQLSGITEISDSLLDLVIEAPYKSAAAVFDAAIREEVDFVVISGDLLDPTSVGPRAFTFLAEQFDKLAERCIEVYWTASKRDLKEGWLRSSEWPDNVRIFASDKLERVIHYRGDIALAELMGRSWHSQRLLRAAEFSGDAAEHFRLAVLSGNLEWDGHKDLARYWACGGSDSASTPFEGRSLAHCPGSPQGFAPGESGPHGCTIVNVDADGSIRTRMIFTDAIRWCHERLPVSLGVSKHESRQLLKTRIKHLAAEIRRPIFVRWTITGEQRFDTLFVQEEDRQETLDWLRSEFREDTPPIWAVSLELEPPDELPPEWCEEDSILGDYLRVAQQYEMSPDRELDLERYLFGGTAPRELAELLSPQHSLNRDRVLREAALLGADLLRGDETPDHKK